jgi:hypothetical protein
MVSLRVPLRYLLSRGFIGVIYDYDDVCYIRKFPCDLRCLTTRERWGGHMPRSTVALPAGPAPHSVRCLAFYKIEHLDSNNTIRLLHQTNAIPANGNCFAPTLTLLPGEVGRHSHTVKRDGQVLKLPPELYTCRPSSPMPSAPRAPCRTRAATAMCMTALCRDTFRQHTKVHVAEETSETW